MAKRKQSRPAPDDMYCTCPVCGESKIVLWDKPAVLCCEMREHGKGCNETIPLEIANIYRDLIKQ